jgi:hypothetical protein
VPQTHRQRLVSERRRAIQSSYGIKSNVSPLTAELSCR